MTSDATTTRRRVQVLAQTAESRGVETVDTRLLGAVHSAQRARSLDLHRPFALIHFTDTGLRLHLVDGEDGRVIAGRSIESITPATIDQLIADHLVNTGRVEAPESDEWRDELLELSRRGRIRLGTSDGTFIMGREHVRLFRVSRRDVEDATRGLMTRIDSIRQQMTSGDDATSFVLSATHDQWPGLRSGLTQLSRLPVITLDDADLPVDLETTDSPDDVGFLDNSEFPTPTELPGNLTVGDVVESVAGTSPAVAPANGSANGHGQAPAAAPVVGRTQDADEPAAVTRVASESVHMTRDPSEFIRPAGESGDFPATQSLPYQAAPIGNGVVSNMLLPSGLMPTDDLVATGPVSIPATGPSVRPSIPAVVPTGPAPVEPAAVGPMTIGPMTIAAEPVPVYEYPQAYGEQTEDQILTYGQALYDPHTYDRDAYAAYPAAYPSGTYEPASYVPAEYDPAIYDQNAYAQAAYSQPAYEPVSQPQGIYDDAAQQQPSYDQNGHYDQAGYHNQIDYYAANNNLGVPQVDAQSGANAVSGHNSDGLPVVPSEPPDESVTGPNITVSAEEPSDVEQAQIPGSETVATPAPQPAAQRSARWEPTSWELDPVLANPVRRPGRTISFGGVTNKRVALSLAGIGIAVVISTITVMALAGGHDDSSKVASGSNSQTTSGHASPSPYADPADLNAARSPVVLYTAPPPSVNRQPQQRQSQQAPQQPAPFRPRPPSRRVIPNPIPGLPPIVLP